MLALLLIYALGLSNSVPSQFATAVSAAQAVYRECIANPIAGQLKYESAEQALAAALQRCRDGELDLRSASKASPGTYLEWAPEDLANLRS